MKISVRVKPGVKENKIEKFSDDRYLVYLKERAEDNKANLALIKLLSKYFGTPKIKIKSGLSSRDKVVEIE